MFKAQIARVAGSLFMLVIAAGCAAPGDESDDDLEESSEGAIDDEPSVGEVASAASVAAPSCVKVIGRIYDSYSYKYYGYILKNYCSTTQRVSLDVAFRTDPPCQTLSRYETGYFYAYSYRKIKRC